MIPDLTSEITFRKLSIFMTFMETGNIARVRWNFWLKENYLHDGFILNDGNNVCLWGIWN